MEKADSSYGVKPARLICYPNKVAFLLDFKSATPVDITRSIVLPAGTTNVTLFLDTVFERDVKPKDFNLKAAVKTTVPDEYVTGKARIHPIEGAAKVAADYNPSYFAMRHYFINGGGPCYLLPLLNGSKTELAGLPNIIEGDAAEATLLVCAETAESLHTLVDKPDKATVYGALEPLLNKQKGYFLVADSDDGVAIPATTKKQTATYFPALQTVFKSRPSDSQINLSGYQDALGNSVATLADLKPVNPGAYAYLIQLLDDALGGAFVTLPASAAVAGVYARNDRERGVWKAPANLPLDGVRACSEVLSDQASSKLSAKGINGIRWFAKRGAVVWGGRTLSVESEDWRYVPVRRLFNSAERDIQQLMSKALFEPNNPATWERVRASIYNYLAALWRKGALLGNSEQDAFFVQVGLDKTMSQKDVDTGTMVVKVGIAAARQAEFIVLKLSQEIQ